MSGESGEGVPLPINSKAEADISEALANAKAETLPKAPQPQGSENPLSPGSSEEEWDSPQERARQLEKAIEQGTADFRSADKQSEQSPHSLSNVRISQNPASTPESTKQQQWEAYKADLAPQEWLARLDHSGIKTPTSKKPQLPSNKPHKPS
jgi:hypothetical protein